MFSCRYRPTLSCFGGKSQTDGQTDRQGERERESLSHPSVHSSHCCRSTLTFLHTGGTLFSDWLATTARLPGRQPEGERERERERGIVIVVCFRRFPSASSWRAPSLLFCCSHLSVCPPDSQPAKSSSSSSQAVRQTPRARLTVAYSC